MEKREYSFNIITGFDIISSKSGQIFYNFQYKKFTIQILIIYS